MVFCNNPVGAIERVKLWIVTKKLLYARRRWRISWEVSRRFRLTPNSSKYHISHTIDELPIFAHEIARSQEFAAILQGADSELGR